MSLFSLGSWIAEERKRAREAYERDKDHNIVPGYEMGLKHGCQQTLRRLTARLRRGR